VSGESPDEGLIPRAEAKSFANHHLQILAQAINLVA